MNKNQLKLFWQNEYEKEELNIKWYKYLSKEEKEIKKKWFFVYIKNNLDFDLNIFISSILIYFLIIFSTYYYYIIIDIDFQYIINFDIFPFFGFLFFL